MYFSFLITQKQKISFLLHAITTLRCLLCAPVYFHVYKPLRPRLTVWDKVRGRVTLEELKVMTFTGEEKEEEESSYIPEELGLP